MEQAVEVQLSRLVMQQKTDEHQYVHLRERDGSRTFPILIGFNEAFEIQRKLCREPVTRPMTHDLIGNLIAGLGYQLRRVVVTELRDRTFFAVLELGKPDAVEALRVDCRPSDAIALAVQLNAPIFVAKRVLDIVAPE